MSQTQTAYIDLPGEIPVSYAEETVEINLVN